MPSNIKRPSRNASEAVALPRFLTVDQAAEMASVDRRTITRWIERGLIPSGRPITRGSARRWIPAEPFARFLAGEVVGEGGAL